MPHAAGSALYVRFIHSGGTVTVTGDQRAVSWDDTQSFADVTAGTDAATSQVLTTYSVTGSLDFVDNGTGAATLKQALYPGNSGTLEWGNYGTASGAPKYSIPVHIESNSHSGDYASEQTFTVSWRNNGAWVTNYDRSNDTW